ncbi:MAG: phasin family protein [Alphaproteobacteria bacterium]|nr:phasin family protein [Alphaproteobacteria bacterium]
MTVSNNGSNGSDKTIAMPTFGIELAEAIQSSLQANMKAAIAIQEELATFASYRAQTNATAGEALSKCKNWDDAVRAQQDWAKTTADDYMQESKKLMELSREAMQAVFGSLVQWRGRTER